ncbi:MAG: MarR family transcriptional regulator [Akkermansia sp.]
MTKKNSLPSSGSNLNETAKLIADIVLHTQRGWILKMAPRLAEIHITYPQFFLLCYLSTEKTLAMSNVAKLMGHSTAAATGVVDKLEEMGYLQRGLAKADRRKILVQITEAGTSFVDEVHEGMAIELANMLASSDENCPFTQLKTLLCTPADNK